jgi:hypothetical protein
MKKRRRMSISPRLGYQSGYHVYWKITLVTLLYRPTVGLGNMKIYIV